MEKISIQWDISEGNDAERLFAEAMIHELGGEYSIQVIEGVGSGLVFSGHSIGAFSRSSQEYKERIFSTDAPLFLLQSGHDLRVLIESSLGMLGIKTRSQRPLRKELSCSNDFVQPSEVYLANADCLGPILKNIRQAATKLPQNIDQLCTVVGGLSFLNILLQFSPKEIVLFDINLHSLEYVKLWIELMNMSCNCEDFIRRIWSRCLTKFFEEERRLTVDNQQKYITMPKDLSIEEDTLARLSEGGRKTYRQYIMHLDEGSWQLMPCWPLFRRIPPKRDGEKGVNTTYYGEGWLKSPETFDLVKRRFNKARVAFVPWDWARQSLDNLLDLSGKTLLNLSNLDAFYFVEWPEQMRFLGGKVSESGGRMTIMTSEECFVLQRNPHQEALRCIGPHCIGRLLEVTKQVPWGFAELKPRNVHYRDYLISEIESETVILHNLVGEGVSRDIFIQVLRHALSQNNRVIILEHNAVSEDWPKENGFFTYRELYDLIDTQAVGWKKYGMNISGIRDGCRNLLFVLDRVFTQVQ